MENQLTIFSNCIKPIRQVYIEVPHVDIGQTILAYSRTDAFKTVKRKVFEKQIHKTASVLKVNIGFKIGNTIHFELIGRLQEMNGFLITGEKANVYLYKFVTPELIYPYGNEFFQLITEYEGLKFRHRFFIENTDADGKRDIWYLNNWNNYHIPLEYGNKINLDELLIETTI